LRNANSKFQSRFNHMEKSAGQSLDEYNLDELEELWQRAKKIPPAR